jgi:hypothetical protein
VASSTPKVHQTTLSKDNDASVGLREHPAVSLGLDGDALDTRVGLETVHVDLIVKVTDVANNGIVLHLPHVVNHDDVLVASGGHNDVSLGENILQGKNLEALHEGLEGTDGVNLSHDDTGTSLLHGGSTALADITITTDNSNLAGNHYIGSPHQAIREGVAATVQIVKLLRTKTDQHTHLKVHYTKENNKQHLINL